jgi:hypothetical protein
MCIKSTNDDQEHAHEQTTHVDQDLFGPKTTTSVLVKHITDNTTKRATNEVLSTEDGGPFSSTSLVEIREILIVVSDRFQRAGYVYLEIIGTQNGIDCQLSTK